MCSAKSEMKSQLFERLNLRLVLLKLQALSRMFFLNIILWLARWTPGRVSQFRALAGVIVLYS